MSYEAEMADAANDHGQRVIDPPTTYVGTVLFGEVVIQQEGQPLSESYPLT